MLSMELKDLGNNIAKSRMAKGLSAYELSQRIGRDRSYISQVEVGKINISIKTLLDICQVLEISPRDLFA